MKTELEAYRDGEMKFETLMQMPDWGRIVRTARRRWPCPSWLDDSELKQVAALAVWRASTEHETRDQALTSQAAAVALACWPNEPTFNVEECWNGTRRSDFDKYVIAQVFWHLRETMRGLSKVQHRKGAKAPREIAAVSLIVDRTSHSHPADEIGFDEWIARRGFSTDANQEHRAAVVESIEALEGEVRAAVEELVRSGSIDTALEKFSSIGRRSRRTRLNQATASILEAVS